MVSEQHAALPAMNRKQEILCTAAIITGVFLLLALVVTARILERNTMQRLDRLMEFCRTNAVPR